MAWIETEKHWPIRSGLKYLPVNLLPQLKALRIDFFFAIGEVESGSAYQPSRNGDHEKHQPRGCGKRVEEAGRVLLKRHFLTSAGETLALIHGKFYHPPSGRPFEEFAEMALQTGVDTKLQLPKAGAAGP